MRGPDPEAELRGDPQGAEGREPHESTEHPDAGEQHHTAGSQIESARHGRRWVYVRAGWTWQEGLTDPGLPQQEQPQLEHDDADYNR